MATDSETHPSSARPTPSGGFTFIWVALLRFILLFLVLGVAGQSAYGQSYLQSYGSGTFSIPLPVENGFIDASNGRLHLEIPLGSYSQRGGHVDKVSLMYDSEIWVETYPGPSWQPTNVTVSNGTGNSMGGWRLVTSGDVGNFSYGRSCGRVGCTFAWYIWTAPDGTKRSFSFETWCAPGSCQPNGSGYSTDGSGFFLSVTNYTNANVYAPDGTLVFTNISGATSQVPKDANGNYYTTGSNGNVTDTLGRVPVTTTVNGNTITYSLLNAQGTTSPFTVTTQATSVSTNFGVSGIGETSGTITTIQSIQLPDGTSYQFTYDSGTTAGHYGLLTSMQLPSGGKITYGYTNFSDASGATNGLQMGRWLNQRTTPDSSTGWSYTPSIVSACTTGQVNCQQQLKVTKPSGDNTIYTFVLNGGAWLTQVQTRDSGSNLLSSVTQCYTFVTVSNGQCTYTTTTGSPANNISLTWKTTTVPIPGGTNLSTTVDYTTDPNYGNLQNVREWKYYSGTLPAKPDRTIVAAFINGTSYVNANILDLVNLVTLEDSGGNAVAQTQYIYDGSTIGSATGYSNHDDTKYGTSNTDLLP